MELPDAIKRIVFSVLMRFVIKPLSGMGLGNIKPIGVIYRFIVGGVIPEMREQVVINDYKLVVQMGGEWGIGGIAKSLIYDGEYEPQTTAVFKELIKLNMRVVDVGANIGYYTVLVSKLVGQGGAVWAFEPESRNFGDLLENIKLNGLGNVVAVQKAVSDKEGIASLYVSKVESGEHSLVPNRVKGKNEVVEVETVKLDDIISGAVDFIKTDTEGNELAVLRGARRLLRGRDIKLVVEFFPEGFGLAGYTVDDLWGLLLDCGFRHMYLLDEWKHEAIPTKPSAILKYTARHKFSGNVLCSKIPIRRLD